MSALRQLVPVLMAFGLFPLWSGCADTPSDDDVTAVIPTLGPSQTPGDDDASSGDDDTTAPAETTAPGDDDASGDDDATQGTEAPTPTPPLQDADGDGVSDAEDCDDGDPLVFPGMEELCDGRDNNCDEVADEGFDLDQDGVTVCAETPDCDDLDPEVYPGAVEQCGPRDEDCNPDTTSESDLDGDGMTPCQGDCDDTRGDVGPGQLEACDGLDNDCDGSADEELALSTYFQDGDGDGFGGSSIVEACAQPAGAVTDSTDCDDQDALVFPEAEEVCNARDDDCDGLVDEGLKGLYYPDGDGDGYGTQADSIEACEAPEGMAANDLDCDDSQADTYPGAPEQCNSVDDDCDGQVDEDVVSLTWYEDWDEDGYGDQASSLEGCIRPDGYVLNAGDCDDQNPEVSPGAQEVCNQQDEDCDGVADNGLSTAWYGDEDGDGYGNAGVTALSCTQPVGTVAVAGDCNDGSATIHPGAVEQCNGVDDDCDGELDEGVKITFFLDADGDGYGSPLSTIQACQLPQGYAIQASDCNDSQSAIHPGAAEVCNALDENCNGQIDEGVQTAYYPDEDGDGFGQASSEPAYSCSPPPGTSSNASDCVDSDGQIYPGADETCNERDDDCDGEVDEGVQVSYYPDADGDHYGAEGAPAILGCMPASGFALEAGDCNDGVVNVHPGAPEQCNSVDDDCDGQVDDQVTQVSWYKDGDGDGYGNAAQVVSDCRQPEGYVLDGTDCHDSDPTIHPGATEVCNGLDDNCSGTPDENAGSRWYRDADSDGHGNPDSSLVACQAPEGYVSTALDCDDTNASINPGATEQCNGRDDDCDGQVDEAVTSSFYQDADGDGYGNATQTVAACQAPVGYVTDRSDCNDQDKAVHPGASEVCNGRDEDCDGQVDEGLGSVYYADKDGDGFGNPNVSTKACTAPAGYIADNMDCNDGDNTIYPGATEVCNSRDDDCDGQVDEGLTSTWYADVDKDGYGSSSSSTQACSQPAGYVSGNTDCDDSSASIHPGATDVCNGKDDDCDGVVDGGLSKPWYADQDKDGYGNPTSSTLACSQPAGYVADKTDCNDANAGIHPGAAEVCDGADNDCDNAVDEGVGSLWYADVDQDGYGNPGSSSQACSKPVGYVSDKTDCNDGNATVYPGATELCDNLDNDCDSQIDEGLDMDGDGYTPCAVPVADCNDANASVYPGAKEVCDGVDANCDGNTDTAWQTSIGLGISVRAGADPATADGSVAHPFPKVQQGIEATRAGCMLVAVSAGTYVENIRFGGRNIKVQAVGGSSNTILDGGAAGSTVTFDAGETAVAVLKGFSIRNGKAPNGGGVFVSSASPTLESNLIQSNFALAYGGGVYLKNSSASLLTNVIMSNTARSSSNNDGRGGGVYADGGSPSLVDNLITSNLGYYYGGGVYLVGGSRASISGGEISLNTAGGYPYSYGGGVYAAGAVPVIRGVTLDGNTAAVGGAGIYLSACTSSSTLCVVEDSVITANKVSNGPGGGIYVLSGSGVQLTRNLISRNEATTSAGGIYMYYSDIEVSNSLIHCNKGGAAGGGLYLDTSYPDILNNTIVENTASSTGGGIYFSDSVTTGLGMVLTNNVIYKNNKYGIYHAGAQSSYVITYNDTFDNKHGDYANMPSLIGTLGNISVNPSFTTYQTDCSETGDNYVPSSSSPLVDAGFDTGLGVDMDGTVRPRDGNSDGTSRYDIGALER